MVVYWDSKQGEIMGHKPTLSQLEATLRFAEMAWRAYFTTGQREQAKRARAHIELLKARIEYEKQSETFALIGYWLAVPIE